MIMAALYEQGMEVFSNASLMFGQRIDAEDVFMMADKVPDNAGLYIDEPHMLADRYAEQSVRNRVLSNGMSMLREKGVRFVMSSVHEDRVAFSLKSGVESLNYPRRFHPSTRPKFPPWCYIRCTLIGPNPFQVRRLSDERDIPRPQGRTPKVDRAPLSPLSVYQAAKLIDSWQKPDVLAGINTTAAALKDSSANNDIEAEFEDQLAKEKALLDAIGRAFSARVEFGHRKRIEMPKLIRIAREHGYTGSDKDAREALKARVSLDSQYKVHYDELKSLFHFPDGFFNT